MTAAGDSLTRLTALLGRPAAAGEAEQETVDLVADLAEQPPVVTHVLRVGGAPTEEVPLGDTELLLVRDVLDAPVYDVQRGHAARVGEIWLGTAPDGSLRVVAVEVGSASTWHRLVPRRHRRRAPAADATMAGLHDLHLATRRGHAAQLAAAASAVHRLDEHQLAGLLTSLPVEMAVDVVRGLPPARTSAAIGHLHPHVSSRLARGLSTTPTVGARRTRRTAGWRLNRPHRKAPRP